MSDERSTQDKALEAGGLALGGIALWIAVLFYPAVVIGIQIGILHKSYDDALMPGTIAFLMTLFVIWFLYAGTQYGNPVCIICLIFLYVFTAGPFVQYLSHVGNAEYLDSWEYDKRLEELGIEWDPCVSYNDWPEQAPFSGFRWFWFLGQGPKEQYKTRTLQEEREVKEFLRELEDAVYEGASIEDKKKMTKEGYNPDR